MDVVVWLRSLGLGKYEAAFRENEIDETVLPSLTEEHLKQLGVTALGHRVKLLDAIAALRNDASVQPPTVTAEPARPLPGTPTAAPVAEAVGERRHLTVMFCDLVGSTTEELNDVILVGHSFQRKVRLAIGVLQNSSREAAHLSISSRAGQRMLASEQTSLSRRKGRRLCAAKTRAGGGCQVRAEPGKARCRFHGGKSTGPKSQAGRARIAEAQRLRWRGYRERVRAVTGHDEAGSES